MYQVIRGLQSGREGLVTNQRQYEFLHQILEQMMTCSEREGEGRRGREEIDYGGKASKKKSKKTKGSIHTHTHAHWIAQFTTFPKS